MTVDSRPERAATPADGPSVHVIRARKLLIGGAVGGVAAAALCLIGSTIAYGTSGLISAALAAAMVLFFYGVGQYVMVLFADAGARTLLTVSMCSYTARVVILGLVLVLYNAHHEAWPTLTPMVIFLTTIIVVAGWLAVEILSFPPANRAYTRLRAPAEGLGAVTPQQSLLVCHAMRTTEGGPDQPRRRRRDRALDLGLRVLSYLIAGVLVYGLLDGSAITTSPPGPVADRDRRRRCFGASYHRRFGASMSGTCTGARIEATRPP